MESAHYQAYNVWKEGLFFLFLPNPVSDLEECIPMGLSKEQPVWPSE